MSFEIDVKGFDEVLKALEDAQEGLTIPVLNRWCQRIESMAKSNSPAEHRDSIKIEVVKLEGDRFDIKLSSNNEVIPYIIDAIKVHLSRMPFTTKAIFETLIKQIEQQIRK